MKRIALRGKRGAGKFVLVDDEDYLWLNRMPWHASGRKDCLYAVHDLRINPHKVHSFKMHRLLMGNPDTQVDHHDGNSLNNQKYNLRVATKFENGRNRKVSRNSTTGYKGVTKRPGYNKWRARIGSVPNRITLGDFNTPQEAARAYNKAALELFGEFARLNII